MEHEVSPPTINGLKRKRCIGSESGHARKLVKAVKSKEAIRIYSWNINGIAPFLQPDIKQYFSSGSETAPRASLRTFLHRHKFPEVVFLQEVKINNADLKTQNAVAKACNSRLDCNDPGPDYQVHFTLPRDRLNARGFGGKVYGVCSIIRCDFAESRVLCVRDVDWDVEGRVSVVELNDKLALWNIYAVNGTDNAYKNPTTGAVRGTRHDRKLEFHKLLLEDCRAMEADGWSHIIAGDLNVAPARIDGHPNLRTWPLQHVLNRADFNEKFLTEDNDDGLQAVDVWRKIKGSEKRYTYHPRGDVWGRSCDRVDLILASRGLWNDGMILDTGILDSPQDRGTSDHVPLWVGLHVARAPSIQA